MSVECSRAGARHVVDIINELEHAGASLHWTGTDLELSFVRGHRPPSDLLALLAQAHDWIAAVVDAEQIVARLLAHPSRGL